VAQTCRFWHVCDPPIPKGRIHPDKKRRDVCATRAAPLFDRWVLVLLDSITPGIDWASEIGDWTPDLQHFDAIVALDQNGSLEWEWPKNSLQGTV
jgi:hypothetical protein